MTDIELGKGADPAVLSCWKETAQYMGKGVRTVQRWEQFLGLPVRRPHGMAHKSAVIAHRHELDLWMQSHWSMRKDKQDVNEITLSSADINKISMRALDLKIQRARILKKEHGLLVAEISLSVKALIQSSDRLSK